MPARLRSRVNRLVVAVSLVAALPAVAGAERLRRGAGRCVALRAIAAISRVCGVRFMNAEGIHLAFVQLRSRLHELLSSYGLLGTLDREHFYNTITEALAAFDGADRDRTSGDGKPG